MRVLLDNLCQYEIQRGTTGLEILHDDGGHIRCVLVFEMVSQLVF